MRSKGLTKRLFSMVAGAMVGISSFGARVQTFVLGATELGTIADETKALEAGEYSISTPEELAKLARLVNNGHAAEGLSFVLTTDLDLTEEGKYTHGYCDKPIYVKEEGKDKLVGWRKAKLDEEGRFAGWEEPDPDALEIKSDTDVLEDGKTYVIRNAEGYEKFEELKTKEGSCSQEIKIILAGALVNDQFKPAQVDQNEQPISWKEVTIMADGSETEAEKTGTGGGGRYTPIGRYEWGNGEVITAKQFTAKFDGDGHEIKLTINMGGAAGVFGGLGEGSEICKLGVAEGSYVSATTSGSGHAGGIAGRASGATISGCYNTGVVTVSSNGGIGVDAGGIVGQASGATISGCYNTGTVSVTGGASYAGGIAGYALGTISGCYYLKKEGDNNGADKGVGNKAAAEVVGNYEWKSLADMQTVEFVNKLNAEVADFEAQWKADTLESAKKQGVEAETLEEAANGLEEKLKAAETNADKEQIQTLLNQVKQVIFVKNSRPENVVAFAFIAGRTPPIWWEKAEIDEALAEVEKVEGVLEKLKENGVDISETEKKLNEIKGKIKKNIELAALNELPGLVEEAKKEILPLALAAVEKIEDEVKLKGKEIDTSEAENSLDGIKEAIGKATTIEQVEEQLTEAQGVLTDFKAKLQALAAVEKIKAEVTKCGQIYGEDTSEKLRELDEIKTAISPSATIDEIEEQLQKAQGVLAGFRTKLQSKDYNLGHTRSGIGGDAGFYQNQSGEVTFRVKPTPGYKASEIITSGSTIIKPGDVVQSVPECLTVHFKKV